MLSKMIKIIDKISDSDMAQVLSILKRKKNYKNRVHNEVRDFVIKNLNIITEGLHFVDKELRVAGGDIDIVAKKGQTFYLVEIKTRLIRHNADTKGNIAQLLGHMQGLNYTLSLFTNCKVNIKLVLVEYARDVGKFAIKYISNSGKIEGTKKIDLKVD